ncbi:YegP family protein [Methylobacillus arboreus]|uniref:YegP family protein n=1 Tax=Methylobacillus arboreus TaxID=755170 RepID=UPI001E59A051|nr:YegP family protein [Methylobacillus arboreus]MCB5191245.1 YegP family protein [Methylobacillus arboreus]
MAGWFEIKKSDKNGQYSFVLKAGNAEVILTSEQYVAKASAENGIESVRTNSPNDARYEKLTASNGKPYFNLKASNGQVIGTSQLYASADSRDKGIESVKTNGSTETVKDNT